MDPGSTPGWGKQIKTFVHFFLDSETLCVGHGYPFVVDTNWNSIKPGLQKKNRKQALLTIYQGVNNTYFKAIAQKRTKIAQITLKLEPCVQFLTALI